MEPFGPQLQEECPRNLQIKVAGALYKISYYPCSSFSPEGVKLAEGWVAGPGDSGTKRRSAADRSAESTSDARTLQ